MGGEITHPQIMKIWTKGKELGLAEDALRNLVEEVTGSRSISGLSKAQGSQVINRLEGKGGIADSKPKIKRKPVPLHNPKVIPLATMKQLDYIWKLAETAGWDNDHLMNFIMKKWKRDNPRKLRIQEAGVLIAILRRAKRGNGRPDRLTSGSRE